jgi:hypothetical protein
VDRRPTLAERTGLEITATSAAPYRFAEPPASTLPPAEPLREWKRGRATGRESGAARSFGSRRRASGDINQPTSLWTALYL